MKNMKRFLTGAALAALMGRHVGRSVDGESIARANRVFGDKTNGLIVDYIGVFRNLQDALAVYAIGKSGGDDKPIRFT